MIRPPITIDQIEQYFKENGVPEGPFQLDKCTRIMDTEKFVEGNLYREVQLSRQKSAEGIVGSILA